MPNPCGPILLRGGLLLAALTPPALAQETPPPANPFGSAPSLLVIGAVVVIVLAFLVYLFVAQRRFFNACREDKQLALFFQSQAGLPEGTVRATIGLLLITVSLVMLVLSMWGGLKFPEMLTGLLGSVIGFYFGSRSGGGEPDKVLKAQVDSLGKALDDATTDAQRGTADGLIGKAEAGLAVVKTLTGLFPEEQGKRYADLADTLGSGLAAAKSLADGDPAAAAAKAGELVKALDADNPLSGIVGGALKDFTPLLKSVAPALGPAALITAVVGVGIKLGGEAYQRWRARVLHLPLSPAVLALGEADATTGIAMVSAVPALRAALGARLDDRPFMLQFAQDVLTLSDLETLRARYGSGFESPAAFEDAIEQARRGAVDGDLGPRAQTLDPALLAPVGGYDPLVQAVDAIHASAAKGEPEGEAALASLDQLMAASDRLWRDSQPVTTLLADAVKEAQS